MGGRKSKFDDLFSTFLRHEDIHIIVIGLKNAGKTTLLENMQLKSKLKRSSATGMSMTTVRSGRNVQITSWDVGGSGKIRALWEPFFTVAKGIIFVVDSTDTETLPEATRELSIILKNNKLPGVPLVVVANKQDQQEAMSISELSTQFRLYECERPWDIIGTNGFTGDGVYEAMSGLVEMIKMYLDQSRRTKGFQIHYKQ